MPGPRCTSAGVGGGEVVGDDVCARVFATGLGKPRGVVVVGPADVVVVDAASGGRLVRVWDGDADGVSSGSERAVVHSGNLGLNHGVEVVDKWLYASSKDAVYRFELPSGWAKDRDNSVLGDPVKVVDGMGAGSAQVRPGDATVAGHVTRTLRAGGGDLFISVGSAGNVDPDPFRSAIRRVKLADLASVTSEKEALWFVNLEVFASGVRNEVALAVDPRDGALWGAENAADGVRREDLGEHGVLHQDNPAEELNRFGGAASGQFYGYPYCFSEFSIAPSRGGQGPGTQWVWQGPVRNFSNHGWTDEKCQNVSEVVPPVKVMQAHSAPLGMTFVVCVAPPGDDLGAFNSSDYVPLPCAWTSNLLVAFHGSWNRDVPTGYKVVRVDLDVESREADAFQTDVLRSANHPESAVWDSGARPVDVVQDPDLGIAYVTSDTTGEVFALSGALPSGDTFSDAASDVSPTLSPHNGLILLASISMFLARGWT